MAAAVAVVVTVIVGTLVFEPDAWWPNVLAELAGLLAGGVVLAIALQLWLDQALKRERRARWLAVWPLVRSRLRRDLETVYELCDSVTDIGATADYTTPLVERLQRTKERLRTDKRSDPVQAVEVIQATYLPLRKHVRRMSEQVLPLAAELQPDDPLVEQLVVLETAACDDWSSLYYYSGRADGANQWPQFRSAIGRVVDAALPIAMRVAD